MSSLGNVRSQKSHSGMCPSGICPIGEMSDEEMSVGDVSDEEMSVGVVSVGDVPVGDVPGNQFKMVRLLMCISMKENNFQCFFFSYLISQRADVMPLCRNFRTKGGVDKSLKKVDETGSTD